jgi:hypothetical protein
MSARMVLSAKLLDPMVIEPLAAVVLGASGLLGAAVLVEEPQAVRATAAAEAMRSAAIRVERPRVPVVVTVPFRRSSGR